MCEREKVACFHVSPVVEKVLVLKVGAELLLCCAFYGDKP